MTRLAETPHCVNNIAPRKSAQIRALPRPPKPKPERLQSPAELHQLALTLYRWRQEGRFEQ